MRPWRSIPKQPNSYFMRAAAYEAKKDYDKSIADLDEAIRLDASRGDFYMLRGVVFGQKGDLDRAITELDQKVKLDPNSTQRLFEARRILPAEEGL